ncbi:T9SS type A sorting domain-containing protein, partial [Flavobacterium cheonhonense]
YNDNIENLVISINNTTKNVNVNWLSENDKIYKIRVYNYNNNSWSSFTNISYPQSNFSFQYNNNATVCSKRYKVEITPVCSGVDGFSNTIVFEVPDIQNPSLTFFSTTQDQALCSGLSYTFTVNAIYPGTSPTYQWKINNNNVGSNSPEFTTSVLQNGDVLSCQIISNEPCMLSQTAVISKTVTVTPQPCSLANEEHNIQLMELYPNPVKEIFTLKSNEVINRVCIYNILGQKILEIPASKTELIIDIANFSNATYFVKIYTESSAKTIKVIKE